MFKDIHYTVAYNNDNENNLNVHMLRSELI